MAAERRIDPSEPPMTSIESTDAQLLRALHDEHAGALWGFVVGLLDGDRTKAQDVVQETFLRAWRNPAVLDQTAGTARGWLFTVARRIVIDDWRSTRRRRELVTADPPDRADAASAGGGDGWDGVADRQLVRSALRTLSPEHRSVLLECYFRGASVAEAARTLGVPEGTVKSRAHYALRALRRAIDDLGGTA